MALAPKLELGKEITMINTRRPLVAFPIAGLCSGICSGVSVILKPMGILAPGLIFGIAIVLAFDGSISRISPGKRANMIAAFIGSYFAAIASTLLSARLPGFGNGLLSAAFAGAIGGSVGSLIIAITLALMIPELSPIRTLLFVTAAGMCFGAAFSFCGVYISDSTHLGHPFDDIMAFSIWQAGVESVIPFCRSVSSTDKAPYQNDL